MAPLNKLEELLLKHHETTNSEVTNRESVQHFFGDTDLFAEFVVLLATSGTPSKFIITPSSIATLLLSLAQVSYEKGISDSANKD